MIVEKDPISLLTEFATRNKITAAFLEHHGNTKSDKFVCYVKLNGTAYADIVIANNKLEGRKYVAMSALRSMVLDSTYRVAFMEQRVFSVHRNHEKYARVVALVHEHFNHMALADTVWLDCNDVLAAVVMESVGGQLTVVAMTTGNRCVRSGALVKTGTVVNDSHADVTVRRALIRYLTSHVWTLHRGENSIFQTNDSVKLRLREGIAFHYYLSSAPCGDAREYVRNTWNDVRIFADPTYHQPIYPMKTCGFLRAKVENGNGAIFTKQVPQHWDGIQGRRLYTMCCSDKLMLWNVVGVQGALLTHFVDPIYFHSVTVGEYCDTQHLARALCCRLGSWSNIPPPYRINHPAISSWGHMIPPLETPKTTGGTTALAVNWTLGDRAVEVIDSTVGVPHVRSPKPSGTYSRLSKLALYKDYRALYRIMSARCSIIVNSYYEAKAAARDYQTVKMGLKLICQGLGFGFWIEKPKEEKGFGIELIDDGL